MKRYSNSKWSKRFPLYCFTEDINLPWIKTWIKIEGRCTGKGSYVKAGIKNKISPFELHYLWMRDGAGKMKKPSINRIRNKGHYGVGNCEFIEHVKNCGLHTMSDKDKKIMARKARKQYQDPSFKEMHSRVMKETNRKLWNDPEHVNRISKLSRKQMKRVWKERKQHEKEACQSPT
jgi:hypothetical protein